MRDFCSLASIIGLLLPQFENTLTLCTSGSFRTPWIMSDLHCHQVRGCLGFWRGGFSFTHQQQHWQALVRQTWKTLQIPPPKVDPQLVQLCHMFRWTCNAESWRKCERACVNISPFSVRWCHLNSNSKHLITVFKKEPSCDSLDNDRQLQRHFATKLSQVDG